jgi:hypothetical protein
MFLGTFSWGFTLEAISQMPAAAPMPEQMNQTQLNANNCVKDEGPIFGPVCFVVRQSQPPLWGCSFLTPRIRPKSLAAPSAPLYEMTSELSHGGPSARERGTRLDCRHGGRRSNSALQKNGHFEHLFCVDGEGFRGDWAICNKRFVTDFLRGVVGGRGDEKIFD